MPIAVCSGPVLLPPFLFSLEHPSEKNNSCESPISASASGKPNQRQQDRLWKQGAERLRKKKRETSWRKDSLGDPVLLACPSNRSRWKPWWKPWWCWLDLDSPKRGSNPLKVQVQAVCQLPGKRELRQKGLSCLHLAGLLKPCL